MAQVKWIQVGKIECKRLGETVELVEKRAYPNGLNRANRGEYRVLAHRCSAGYKCTHMENPCVWMDPAGDGRQYNR